MYKMIQDHKNCTRIGRKPIPEDIRKDFAEKSKEYHAFKTIERLHIERENNDVLKTQILAMDAIVHLPDYLMEECLSENGEN